MIKRRASAIIFYDKKGNILLQDRRKISKYGEEYGFFGGEVEEGETPEEALMREINEELGFKLKDFKLFKSINLKLDYLDMDLELFLFIAKIPTEKLIIEKGDFKFVHIEQALNLNLLKHDLKLLEEFKNVL